MVPSEPGRQAAGSESPAPQPRLVPTAESGVLSDDGRNTSPTLVEPGTEPFPACNVSQPANALISSDHDAAHQRSGGNPFPVLRIRTTDLPAARPVTPINETEHPLHHSMSTVSLPRRTPSCRATRLGTISSNDSLSPASTIISSPQLAAMGDITPLPSPIAYVGSPWRFSGRAASQSLSRTPSTISRSGSSLGLRTSDSSQVIRSASRSRSRPYYGPSRLDEDTVREDGAENEKPRRHTRNRSLSEYVPTKVILPPPRPVAVSGSGPPNTTPSSSDLSAQTTNLHREQYLAVQRGIAFPSARPPTPPRSSRSGDEDDNTAPIIRSASSIGTTEEIYSVRSIRTKQPRKYRKLRQLGQGTFSQVSLAVRIGDDEADNASHDYEGTHRRTTSKVPQKLVAVKIIEYGPAGGADEDRVEVSLKREVDILKSINHPSLVQLKAFGSDEKRALLVLDYCPGGDLFEFATSGVKPLGPDLIRRIFAELVAAVRYLHAHYIVHRDIKLENVLVNPPASVMQEVTDWRTYDRAVVTLTDLGLSRRIPEPPESPLLHTRCGSEDYAAPEILMGQPYDGRATDAWALGVLLYAMMETRLPFDALPGTRGDPAKLRARTPHRIARCEWSWYRYADEDGEWDPEKGKDLEGARECVEGLLKRTSKRKSLDEIAKLSYVHDAIDVPNGLKRGDKEVP
ncbi:hypothetical protein VTN77DRAFT_6291 [Rasamsonia byssochlamydoides]|uniref:uncharacterized protein n=1 Tax=Rasamsonia byssochlamydoides TaxID=89139 RepID=UPI003743674F